MSGFVVMVRGVDDSYSAYGPVREQDRADSFARWFNARVDKYDAANPTAPSGVAWAYVMDLRKLDSAAMVRDSGLPDA